MKKIEKALSFSFKVHTSERQLALRDILEVFQVNYRSNRFYGILFTSASALIYGLLPVLTNLSYAAGSNAETFNFFKSAWAVPFLGIILFIQKKSIILPKKLMLWAVLAGVLGKGITSLLLYSSYNYVPGGMATTLHFMYPLFAAVLGRILLGKRLPAYKWATLLMATLSVSLLVELNGGFGSLIGIACAVGSGVVYAAYILAVDQSGISDIDPLVFAFYLAVSGSAFSLVYGLSTETLRLDTPAVSQLYMAIAAIATSIVAAACFQQGIRRLGGATAAFFSLFEPVSSCIFGAMFLHERMNIKSASGVVLILLAVVIMICFDYRSLKRGKISHE